MALTEEQVLAAIRRNVLELLPELSPEQVRSDRTLADLGCNSIDRVDVVSMTMEDLGVTIPITEFAQVGDIGALAEVLRRRVP